MKITVRELSNPRLGGRPACILSDGETFVAYALREGLEALPIWRSPEAARAAIAGQPDTDGFAPVRVVLFDGHKPRALRNGWVVAVSSTRGFHLFGDELLLFRSEDDVRRHIEARGLDDAEPYAISVVDGDLVLEKRMETVH